MSKTIPSSIVLPDLQRISVNKAIRVTDWKTLNQALNYHFGRTGALIGGMSFDPAWQTSSASYTQVNADTSGLPAGQPGANYDLSMWQGLWLPTRKSYSSGDKYVLELNCYAENIDIRVTFTELAAQSGTPPSTDTSAGTTVTTGSTNTAAITGAGWINLQSAPVSSSVWVLLYVEAKTQTGAGTGYIHQFSFREKFLDSSRASSLPQGS